MPPIGPSLGSRSERSAASRRGYIRRVKYEADGGRELRGLSGPLLIPLLGLPGVFISLFMPFELRFLLPDLEEGL